MEVGRGYSGERANGGGRTCSQDELFIPLLSLRCALELIITELIFGRTAEDLICLALRGRISLPVLCHFPTHTHIHVSFRPQQKRYLTGVLANCPSFKVSQRPADIVLCQRQSAIADKSYSQGEKEIAQVCRPFPRNCEDREPGNRANHLCRRGFTCPFASCPEDNLREVTFVCRLRIAITRSRGTRLERRLASGPQVHSSTMPRRSRHTYPSDQSVQLIDDLSICQERLSWMVCPPGINASALIAEIVLNDNCTLQQNG